MYAVLMYVVVGSHVFDGAAEGVSSCVSIQRFFAESKVCENYMSLAVQHDILWLQVSGGER